MSKIIAREIFIPRSFGDRDRHGWPEIIYVKRYLKTTVEGSRFPEDVEAGRSGSYPITRCIPYSDQAWHLCQQHMAKRAELEQEYKQLEKMARRRKPNNGRTMTGATPPEGQRPEQAELFK